MITEIAIGVGTALIIGLGYLLRRGILAYLRDDIKAHLVPNGGSSLADRLTKVEQAIEKLTTKAEETGCLPGCPARHAFPHIGTQAPWTMGAASYGSHPVLTADTQPPSRPSTPMPQFVPPI